MSSSKYFRPNKGLVTYYRILHLFLNEQVFVKIYFLKLLYQILFTKIDEEPISSEYSITVNFIKTAFSLLFIKCERSLIIIRTTQFFLFLNSGRT